MTFTLTGRYDGEEALIAVGERGDLDGFPSAALEDVRARLEDMQPRAATPTGPFFPPHSPHGYYLTILDVLEGAVRGWGEVPVFPDQGDELDVSPPPPDGGRKDFVPTQTPPSPFAEHAHPRDAHGRWIRKLGKEAERALAAARVRARSRGGLLGRKSGDPMMQALIEDSHRGERPTLVHSVEFDRMVSEGRVEKVWLRGQNRKRYSNAFLHDDDYYVGAGIYGSGTYWCDNPVIADKYATMKEEPGGVVRMGLKQGARVVDWQEIVPDMRAAGEDLSRVPGFAWQPSPNMSDEQVEQRALWLLLRDPGRFAALQGYDAIRVPSSETGGGGEFLVLLNRGAVVADETVYDPEFSRKAARVLSALENDPRLDAMRDAIIRAGSFEALPPAARDLWLKVEAHGNGDTKATVRVRPYVREGRPVSGYVRRQTLAEIAEEVKEQFTEALRTRTKHDYKWKPPEGWADVGRSYDGVVQFARNIEHGDGQRATLFVRGRHAGKRGQWKVGISHIDWGQFSPHLLEARDAVEEAVRAGVDDDEFEKMHERFGLFRDGGKLVFKRGDEALNLHGYGKNRFVHPTRLDETSQRFRLERLLDKDDPAALVVGETTKSEFDGFSPVGTGFGPWRFTAVDEEAGVYDLTWRREDRVDKGIVEVKGHRLRFDESGVLAEVGKPSEGTDLGTEDDFAKIAAEEKARVRQENEERNSRIVAISDKVKAAIAGNGEIESIAGDDWDEVREALERLRFEPLKRNNRKVGYTEVWRRKATGTEIYFQVDPTGVQVPSRYRQRGYGLFGRPRSAGQYVVKADKSKLTKGVREHARGRITDRLPQNEDEWKQDMLGRADELAERYGEAGGVSVITFAKPGQKGPPDMNAYIDSNGVVVLGEDVLDALIEFRDYASGTVTPGTEKARGRILARAWRAMATAQHEINHSVNRSSGWFGGYSDHDGTKNFEETLTEELARVMVGEWIDSQDAGDLNAWAEANAARQSVQGAYQVYRANFKGLLDGLEVPPSERRELLERWKFNVSYRERMKEFSEMIAEKLDLPEEDAADYLGEVLRERNTRVGDFTRGALRVQEFRPILELGPLPPVRPEEELKALLAEVQGERTSFLQARTDFDAALAALRQAQWGRVPLGEQRPDAEKARAVAEAAQERLNEAREAYTKALAERDLVPPEGDYE